MVWPFKFARQCKVCSTFPILSGSEDGVSQRHGHHLWISWWWHVRFVLERIGSLWTTYCDWHDFPGALLICFCLILCYLQIEFINQWFWSKNIIQPHIINNKPGSRVTGNQIIEQRISGCADYKFCRRCDNVYFQIYFMDKDCFGKDNTVLRV